MRKSWTTVAIVADPGFGAKALQLRPEMHVWIVRSPDNQPFVEQLRESGREITTFDADPGASGEDAVLEILPDVELHHGEYSQSPSWQHLRVYGAEASAELDIVLRDFGFGEAEAVSNGFQCSKSEDPGAPNEP